MSVVFVYDIMILISCCFKLVFSKCPAILPINKGLCFWQVDQEPQSDWKRAHRTRQPDRDRIPVQSLFELQLSCS